MHSTGNIEYLKKEIEKTYLKELDQFRHEAQSRRKDELKKIEASHKKEVRDVTDSLEKEKQSEYRTTLSEEMLGAKKDFEEAREKQIINVFSEAENRCDEMLYRDDYIDRIKGFVENCSKISGGSERYKEIFPDIEINNRQKGIVVERNHQVFDFTFDTFIESRKLDLRHKISKVLFKDVN